MLKQRRWQVNMPTSQLLIHSFNVSSLDFPTHKITWNMPVVASHPPWCCQNHPWWCMYQYWTLFMTETYSIVWKDHMLLICSSAHEHLSCFCFWACHEQCYWIFMNKCLWACAFILSGIYPGAELLVALTLCLTFLKRTKHCFSRQLCHSHSHHHVNVF